MWVCSLKRSTSRFLTIAISVSMSIGGPFCPFTIAADGALAIMLIFSSLSHFGAPTIMSSLSCQICCMMNFRSNPSISIRPPGWI